MVKEEQETDIDRAAGAGRDRRGSKAPSSTGRDRDPYKFFISGMRSTYTRHHYEKWLRLFFESIDPPLGGKTLQEQCTSFVQKARKDRKWPEECVLDYLGRLKDRVYKKEMSAATARSYIFAPKLFCDINKINRIEWKWLIGGLPRSSRSADDRAPTLEEVRKIMEYPDRRLPSILTTMVSSGIRIGAWDFLKWGHVEPIFRPNEDGNNKLVAAKIRVYVGESDRYTTFITPEAYHSLEKWMDFRKQCGENVTKDSWVMRTLWNTLAPHLGDRTDVHNPQKLDRDGVRILVSRAQWAQGVKTKLAPGIRRHEFKEDHGFRKFFRTRAEHAGMRPSIAKMLMGHSLGLDDSYFKPTENEMLEDYLKVVPSLTIGDTITEERAQVIAKAAAIKATEVAERKLEVERERHYREFEELKKEQEKLKKMFLSLKKSGQVKTHPIEDEEVAKSSPK
jgi:hypothetical protein